MATAIYWRSRSPLPFQTTWDGLLHLSIIERMLDANQFSLSLRNISPGFAFDAYLPGFHLNLGIASRFSGVPVLNELWAGPFVLVAIAGAGLFAFTVRTWSSVAAACGSTVITGLLMTTRKSTNPLLAILPAAEVMAFIPLALFVLTDPDRRRGLRRGLLISVVLCSVHTLMGLLLFGVILACHLLSAALGARRWIRIAIIAVLVVAGVGAAVLYGFAGPLRFHVPLTAFDPTSFYANLTPDAGLRARLGGVNQEFPAYLPGVLVVAAIAAMLVFRRTAPQNAANLPVVVVVGYACPVIGLERLEGFLWIAFSVATASVLAAVEKGIRSLVRSRRIGWTVGVATALVIPLLAAPTLIQPLSKFRAFQVADTSETWLQSSFSKYELTSFQAFAQQHGRGLPVVSDPMTQQIAEGLARLDSIGGMSTPAQKQYETARILMARTSHDARADLALLQRQLGRYVLVVTGRCQGPLSSAQGRS